MDRRSFLQTGGALALLAASPASLLAQPRRFTPTRFSVEVRGRGRDVILIPGLMSGRHVWNAAVRGAPGYRYHLLQIAGFAGEPVRGNANGRILPGVVEELSRYIEANRLDRPAIVGHSMGGIIGMMLTTRYPARVGRLMVVDMLPRPTAMYGGEAGSGLANVLEGWIDNAFARRALSGLIAAFSPPEESGGSDPDVSARAMHELGRTDLTAELPRIRAPMTVLYAAGDTESRASADAAFRAAYRAVPGVRLVRIDASGHAIMADQPRLFAEQMRLFLR